MAACSQLPAALVPELFGKQRRISLEADGKRYVLERPKQVGDGLLVAGTVKTRGTTTTVQLVAAPSRTLPASTADANARAPATRPYRRYDAAARVVGAGGRRPGAVAGRPGGDSDHAGCGTHRR